MALKIYKKELDYSYSLGTFPTIELLSTRPEQCRTVLLAGGIGNPEGIVRIKQLCEANHINIDIADKLISKIAIKDKTQVVGVFRKYGSKLLPNQDHIVLVNPSAPGNVGTIIRSAVGFGVDNLAIIKPAVDIFDPKVIRSSMGAVFKINFEYYDSLEAYRKNFSNNTIYPFTLNGRNKLMDTNFETPASLIFGNEGEGLAKFFDVYATSVRIEHNKGIDSLNLASATSIALYRLYNQRQI